MKMYSAKAASWLNGLAAAVLAGGTSILQIEISSMPTPAPLLITAIASLVMGVLSGAIMAGAVRVGLYLARCAALAGKYVAAIPLISLPVVGFVLTRPMETHAVMITSPGAPPVSNSLPAGLWFGLSIVALIPVLIAWLVGRLARRTGAA